MHFSGADFQDIGLSVPFADFQSRFCIFGKMHILPGHRQKSFVRDRIQKAFGRAMPEKFRRLTGLQSHIDRNRMSLIGADSGLIRRKAVTLFLICADNFFQQSSVKMKSSVLVDFLNQDINICPAALIVNLNADCFRAVPENQTQELADSGQRILFVHAYPSFLSGR